MEVEYYVAVADNLEDLEEKVNEKISYDWIPQGGVAISNYVFESAIYEKNQSEYCQALLRIKR